MHCTWGQSLLSSTALFVVAFTLIISREGVCQTGTSSCLRGRRRRTIKFYQFKRKGEKRLLTVRDVHGTDGF